MAEGAAASGPLPVVPYLKIPASGDPVPGRAAVRELRQDLPGRATTCSNCGERDRIEARSLAKTGTLYVYSIVHRSFPGIEVPYVSAIVDLDGGGTVKGNLIGIDPDAGEDHDGHAGRGRLQEGARAKDAEGNEYLTYYFQPRS